MNVAVAKTLIGRQRSLSAVSGHVQGCYHQQVVGRNGTGSEAIGVRLLDFLGDLLDKDAVVFGGPSQIIPMTTGWDIELVEIGGDFVVKIITPFGNRSTMFVIPRIRQPFEEQHRENEVTEVARVHRATEDVRGTPEPRLKFLLGDRSAGHRPRLIRRL